MGAVHGVFLKYVAVSATAGAAGLLVSWESIESLEDLPRLTVLIVLGHTCLVNGAIAILFNLGVGMRALGKDPRYGSVPLWSYILFFGFHGPTWLYTRFRHWADIHAKIPAATEVEPGWWIGGRYAAELGQHFAGTVDLTCEFPEGCISMTDRYLLCPCWDGVPPTAELLDNAANFAVAARAHGDVLVHCAHGRGRSTTVLCACLVKAGLHTSWETALESIKCQRRVVKLNRAMRAVLNTWQVQYMASTPVKAAKKAEVTASPLKASGLFLLVRDWFQGVFAAAHRSD
eukprot:TRINITY_DN93476_c0_g1_i1.p1 TRINITY_DN93476_c0_g1~~TRINITY_DN93476_c0_g1_i1.p1  ORF type:complete len:296 (-),score=41.49 TRINITY_DN93476_c0_g1_i1:26-889(-)